jgi:hypothetical protein
LGRPSLSPPEAPTERRPSLEDGVAEDVDREDGVAGAESVLIAYELLRAVALPPLRPAAFFWAVVPPCDDEERDDPEPEAFPPRLEAPGELAIFAARSFDIPLSFNASYCCSFFTFARLLGIIDLLRVCRFRESGCRR